MTMLICGKCKEEFRCITKGRKHGYGMITCPHCGKIYACSKKEYTGNLVGRKHIHIQYKDGDILN